MRQHLICAHCSSVIATFHDADFPAISRKREIAVKLEALLDSGMSSVITFLRCRRDSCTGALISGKTYLVRDTTLGAS